MTKNRTPSHKAALYFNELAPIRGEGERCALFGHFYHLPDPDVSLTRPVAALPNGAWGVVNDIDVNEIVSAAVYFEVGGKRQLFAVYRSGETFLYQGTTRTAIAKPAGVGFLSGANMIGDDIYACGSQNVILRFDGAGWVDAAPSLRVPYGGPNDPILNAVDGFSESEIYAVGYNGSIVQFDGSTWRALDSPTNQHLHQVVCHADGKVYLCGRGGTIFRGGPEGWEDLALSGFDEDFWGMATYGEQVYACSYRRLFRVTDVGLVGEAVAVNSAGTFYRLASNKSYLWATTGTGRILRFDGRAWIEMTWPDSV
jgi:hypothetical protein